MQTFIKYLVLLILSFFGQLITAQDTLQNTNNKEKIDTLLDIREHIKTEERDLLKTEVEFINTRLERGELSNEEASVLKKEAAKKRALNIENRISIIDNQIALLRRNEDGYSTSDLKEASRVGFSIGSYEGTFAGIDIKRKKKPKKYDKRTTSDFVLAFGLNNAIIEGQSLDDSPYKFGGSRFLELGWAWKTRVFKNTNFLRVKYGYSFQVNGLKPDDNQYFVQQGNQVVLENHPQNLKKSKLSATNLVFPIHLEFGPSKKIEGENYFRYVTRRQFKMGLGAYGGFNIGTRQKLKYDLNGERIKDKQKRGFNTSDLVYGVSGYLAFGEMALYVKYDLSPIFKDQIIEQNNISMGVRFDID